MTVKELINILTQLPEEKEIHLDSVRSTAAIEVYELGDDNDNVVYITDDAVDSIDYCEHEGINRIINTEGTYYYEFKDEMED